LDKEQGKGKPGHGFANQSTPNAVLSGLLGRAGLYREASGQAKALVEDLPAQLLPEGSLAGLVARTSWLILPVVTVE